MDAHPPSPLSFVAAHSALARVSRRMSHPGPFATFLVSGARPVIHVHRFICRENSEIMHAPVARANLELPDDVNPPTLFSSTGRPAGRDPPRLSPAHPTCADSRMVRCPWLSCGRYFLALRRSVASDSRTSILRATNATAGVARCASRRCPDAQWAEEVLDLDPV